MRQLRARCSWPLALFFVAGAVVAPRQFVQSVLAQPGAGAAVNAAPVGLAEEGAAWGAWNALREKLKGAPAEEMVTAYNGFFTANPALHPVVANAVLGDVGGLYRDNLKQPDKALEFYDWGLAKYKAHDASILMVEGKSRTLLNTARAAEAGALMEEQWPQIIRAARGEHPHLRLTASRCVQVRFEALQKQKKTGEALSLLSETLEQAPVFLDGSLQIAGDWSQGWMYNALVIGLIEAKKVDEAAGWARLAFAESAFNKGSIDSATELAGRVWAAREDFVAARQFASAQDDIKRPNPLAKEALPKLSAALLGEEMKRLEQAQAKSFDRGRASQIVSILIALGQLRPAMEQARQILVKSPTAPEGVQQVARVFKAADLSLVRANGFIAYLDGKGENPLPAFMKQPDAPTADKTP